MKTVIDTLQYGRNLIPSSLSTVAYFILGTIVISSYIAPVETPTMVHEKHEQRPPQGFCTSFKGKEHKIEESYKQFWNITHAHRDVQAYSARISNHVYDETRKGPTGTTPFTDWVGPTFCHNKDVKARLIGNLHSYYAAQYPGKPYRAGMSMVHIMAIPTENIYNGVTLDLQNVYIVDEMIKLFKDAWANPKMRQKVYDHQVDAVKKAGEGGDRATRDAALKHLEHMREEILNLSVDNFQFGFHLYPDNSIEHLHMHIVAMGERFRRYSTNAHDAKTVDAVELRNFIKLRLDRRKTARLRRFAYGVFKKRATTPLPNKQDRQDDIRSGTW